MCSEYNVNYRNDLPRWHKVPQHSRAAGAASDDLHASNFFKVKKEFYFLVHLLDGTITKKHFLTTPLLSAAH